MHIKIAKKHLNFKKCRLTRFFPILRWSRAYNLEYLLYDAVAGLTVGMTVIPQGIAYAKVAGLPIEYGLYSSFMGAFIYTFLGTSKDVTYGPTAVMSLMTYRFVSVAVAKTMNTVFASNELKNEITLKEDVEKSMWIHYSLILTLIAGIIQALMGFLRLGFLTSFISHPVLHGFTNGAAIIIGVSQIKDLLGIKVPKSNFIQQTYYVFRHIKQAKKWDCIIGISSLVLLLILKRCITLPCVTKKIVNNPIRKSLKRTAALENGIQTKSETTQILDPLVKNVAEYETNKSQDMNRNKWWSIILIFITAFQKIVWLALTSRNALIIAISGLSAYLLSSHLSLPPNAITLTSAVTNPNPIFAIPNFNFQYKLTNVGINNNNLSNSQPKDKDIYLSFMDVFKDIGFGFVSIAIISILETLAIAKAFARKYKYTIDSTQEFIALGVANIASSFVGSYPMAGSFSRSALNAQTGVKTPAGGIFTGLLVILAMRFLTAYFRFIPIPSLAALIITAIINLIDFKTFYHIYLIKKTDFTVAFITFITCFIWGIEMALVLGIALSLAFLIYPISKPRLNMELYKDITSGQYYFVVKPDQALLYPSSEFFTETLVSQCIIEPQIDTFEESFTNVGSLVIADSRSNEDDLDQYGKLVTSYDLSTSGKQRRNGDSPERSHNISKTKIRKLVSPSTKMCSVIVDCHHLPVFDYSTVQSFHHLHGEFKAVGKEFILCNIKDNLYKHIAFQLKGIKNFPSLKYAQAYITDKFNADEPSNIMVTTST